MPEVSPATEAVEEHSDVGVSTALEDAGAGRGPLVMPAHHRDRPVRNIGVGTAYNVELFDVLPTGITGWTVNNDD